MAVSQKVTVVDGAEGAAPTVTTKDAELLDIVTTAMSTESAVTGTYGLIQRAGLVLGGMSLQSYIKNNTFNFLK